MSSIFWILVLIYYRMPDPHRPVRVEVAKPVETWAEQRAREERNKARLIWAKQAVWNMLIAVAALWCARFSWLCFFGK